MLEVGFVSGVDVHGSVSLLWDSKGGVSRIDKTSRRSLSSSLAICIIIAIILHSQLQNDRVVIDESSEKEKLHIRSQHSWLRRCQNVRTTVCQFLLFCLFICSVSDWPKKPIRTVFHEGRKLDDACDLKDMSDNFCTAHKIIINNRKVSLSF